jgi:hypothetical protein
MRVCTFVVGILFLAGCSGGSVAPVSGTVKLDGKPLPHATVVFQPDGGGPNPGPGSTGKTDANGHYELQVTTTNARGAVVGKHKVSITAYEGDGEPDSSAPNATVFRKALVPVEYNANTKLTFDVPSGGSTTANFDLTSSAPK